jgi:hypothetical protein
MLPCSKWIEESEVNKHEKTYFGVGSIVNVERDDSIGLCNTRRSLSWSQMASLVEINVVRSPSRVAGRAKNEVQSVAGGGGELLVFLRLFYGLDAALCSCARDLRHRSLEYHFDKNQ